MRDALIFYNVCIHWAIENEYMRWNQVPKFHYFAHISLQSRYINPRSAWTYGDESYMQTIQRIGKACVAGTTARNVVQKMVEKYARGMSVRLA